MMRAVRVKKSLIREDDVERIFGDDEIKKLAKTLRLPTNTDLISFGESVRQSVRHFLTAKAQLTPVELRDEIKRLYQLSVRADRSGRKSTKEKENLAKAIESLPNDVRGWLDRVFHRTDIRIPTGAEIRSPDTYEHSVKCLRSILSYGGVARGRQRSDGMKPLKPLLRAPVLTGRPRNVAERKFIQWLAFAVKETGHHVPQAVHNDARGPFSQFVHDCFSMAGAPTGSQTVTTLINEREKNRREMLSRESRKLPFPDLS